MAAHQSTVIDLRPTIAPKSDQLNADDLIGTTKTITITSVRLCGEPDQPVAVHFEGDNGKPYKPGKSMRRVMVKIWGDDASQFVGRRMTLYRDDSVKFGGLNVGGIRISHMSEIDREVAMVLSESKTKRQPFSVKPLFDERPNTAPKVNLAAILPAGRAAASKGSAALIEWWKSLGKPEQAVAKATLDDELKPAAAKADQAALGDDDGADDGFPGDQPRQTLAERVQAFKDGVKAAPTSAAMRAVRDAADQLFRDIDAGDPDETGVTAKGLDRWVDDQVEGREEAEREGGDA